MLRPGEHFELAGTLPHGPGMLLLERLSGYTADTLTCEVDITPATRFCDGRAVPGWVGLEYMAQAVGAFTGISRLQEGKPVQLKMLLGSRAYDCAVPGFGVGSTLSVSAHLLFWDPDGVCAFACEIREQGKLLASAEIKGFEPEDIEPFLRQVEADA